MDMIIKTRRRFLTLMMFVTTAITVLALASVYLLTYSNQESANRKRLNSIEKLMITENAHSIAYGTNRSTVLVERTSADIGTNFSVITDAQGRTVTIISNLSDMSVDLYETAKNIALNGTDYGTAEFAGRVWQYVTAPAELNFSLSTDQSNETTVDNYLSDENYQIRFVDITESRQTLRNLALILVIIGVSLLVFFFFFSLFFSKRAVAPLAEVLEKQRQFVADASHELKTPVSIIKANSGVLYANADETVISQKEWLDGIATGANRMASLIQGLLALSKIEGSDGATVNSDVSIKDEVDETLNLMNVIIKEKSLAVEKDISGGVIRSNRAFVRQVLEIVLDNAIKYSGEGGLIRVSGTREKKQYRLSVYNTGEGIPADELEKIFDRFYRAETARTQDGSYGLGLSIARVIMRQLGGTVTAESVPGQSATFILKFPVRK